MMLAPIDRERINLLILLYVVVYRAQFYSEKGFTIIAQVQLICFMAECELSLTMLYYNYTEVDQKPHKV